MLQTENRPVELQALKGKILAAYEYLSKADDKENAVKVKELAAKILQEEFSIAFCGHFSAGKSTIINRLAGENLLPSSPIPTSANLVKVKSGTEYAKVFFKNEKPRLYLAPYDYELVKKYCKDGDQIKEIEISHANSTLPKHTVIIDTPGIDSTDDAHRIATESAIHLADLIFYVMDYNHVQSEINFMFSRELTAAGKEVYLVINQIDKHSEDELSFGDFKSSVVESFASWGVKPADIFYTSLKRDEHEHNQFAELQSFLHERLKEKDELLLRSVFHSLQKILWDHLALQSKKNEPEIQRLNELLQELPPREREELTNNYSRLLEEQNQLEDGVAKAEGEFDAAVNKIMANAHLMRFETRALAESYLEACQSGFKVGFLFSKQKTAAARAQRLELFYQDICQKAKSQLEWHLRDFLLQFARTKRLENEHLAAEIQKYGFDFSDDLLSGAVKSGARLSGDTVINYTDNIAGEIKRLAKSGLEELKREMLAALEERNKAAELSLQEKTLGLQKYLEALQELNSYAQKANAAQKELETMLDTVGAVQEESFALLVPQEAECEIISGALERPEETKLPAAPLVNELPRQATSEPKPDRMKQTAQKLIRTAKLLEEVPGFAKLAAELAEKAERLEHKGFTVALFGAFSAGKSSFANALLGEKVLPVSPNPTTAAINKIKPVDDLNPHGTVRIKLKEAGAMLDDVNHALKIFDQRANDLAEARVKAAGLRSLENERQEAAQKTNHAFLQAFVRGYEFLGDKLGGMITTTHDAFGDYIAIEEKSCFVEWAELYFDCPLTRQGITLVDTPGADSINARHTGVAFEFIKNSDAILFVTYYNHAFSKADREFLMQLGRVKDAFQLDKMFFIINAVDLAENEAEKEIVVEYVREQLLKYGVRNPHLYSLSSVEALEEKQSSANSNASGLGLFEEAFYHFIGNDLSGLAVAASENELKRVLQLVEKLIASAKEDEAVKAQKRAGLEAEKAGIRELLEQQTEEALQKRLRQEIEVLLYYIKQRVFLRFNEFFREAFNPSVLKDDGRDLKKALRQARSELVASIGFELAQELRATTLRLDRFTEKMTLQQQLTLSEKISAINKDISFSAFECREKAQIEFTDAFLDVSEDLFGKAMAYFKNPKSFFAKQENKLMGEELYNVLAALADQYLQAEEKRLDELYQMIAATAVSGLKQLMQEQAEDYYLSLLAAFEGGVPEAKLSAIRQSLSEV